MIFIAWLALHVCCRIASGLIVGERERPKGAQWLIVALWYAIPLSWLLVRTEPGEGAFVAGFVLYGLGSALVTAARKVNPYFVPRIVMPEEVIRIGVYRWLSHPGYCGMVMMGLGTVFMLGNPLGLVPLIHYSIVLVWRARKEGRLIQRMSNKRNFPLDYPDPAALALHAQDQ